ncbi:MAG: CDP-diacylglycerol--serine O-phosphatidyltransferase [Rhodopirellula sp.]|nr:CDP-diacylglycerol--serine O-phosphatidyltransferase [Rhodopirellula sp.]
MRLLKTVYVFPTSFTLGNLVCGFFAIVVAARVARPESAEIDPTVLTDLMLSGWLIFLAMIFDALDGHVARLSRSTSDFGAQLDSLCDLVTFGVAPAFLLVKLCPRFAYLHREAVWVIAASFVACAALRLARFNVETGDEDEHLYFSGLPSPAAAAPIASFAIMFYTLHNREDGAVLYADQIYSVLQSILPLFAIALALLMVSRIPYPHVVNQVFRGQKSFSHVVKLVFALVAIMVIRGYSVPLLCTAYALGPPARFFWEKIVQRRHQEDPLF